VEAGVLALKDAQLDAFARISEAGEIEEPKQGVRVCNFTVVAGQESQTFSPQDEVAYVGFDACEAATKHEGDRHIQALGRGEVSPKMRQKGICATGNKRSRMGRPWRRGGFWLARGLNLVAPDGLGHFPVQIRRLAGDDRSDTAARFLNVSPISRNDMQVQVKDRLPCRLAKVHADVVAMGMVHPLDD
jgi:hypothetical protein